MRFSRAIFVAAVSVASTAACGVLFPLDEFRDHGSHDGGTAGTDAGDAASVPGAPGAYAQTVLADQPVLYLRLGEKSDTVAHDELHRNDGAYHGGVRLGVPGLIAGDADTAVAFDGNGGTNVSMASGFDFAGTASFSVEVWAMPTASPKFSWPVDHFEYRSPTTRNGWGLDFAQHNVNLERWNGTFITGASSTFGLELNRPHHVVGTYDGARARVYIDGAKAGDAATTIALDPLPGGWTIGSQNCGCDGSNFAGTLDEVAIYDKALSAERVLAHYKAGTAR